MMDRRTFLKLPAAAYVASSTVRLKADTTYSAPVVDLAAIERPRVLAAARRYLGEQSVTITAAASPRSAGGPHDFFSEGDYWRSRSWSRSSPTSRRGRTRTT